MDSFALLFCHKMDSQAPDSQCSKLCSHHPPLIPYRPMVSSATRTHRLVENCSSTPHLFFFPSPETRTFSPSSPLSRHRCGFRAEFPFHLPARRSLLPTGGTPWIHAATAQVHHNHLVPQSTRPIVPVPVPTLRLLVTKVPSPVSAQRVLYKWVVPRLSQTPRSPALLAPATPLWGQVLASPQILGPWRSRTTIPLTARPSIGTILGRVLCHLHPCTVPCLSFMTTTRNWAATLPHHLHLGGPALTSQIP